MGHLEDPFIRADVGPYHINQYIIKPIRSLELEFLNEPLKLGPPGVTGMGCSSAQRGTETKYQILSLYRLRPLHQIQTPKGKLASTYIYVYWPKEGLSSSSRVSV